MSNVSLLLKYIFLHHTWKEVPPCRESPQVIRSPGVHVTLAGDKDFPAGLVGSQHYHQNVVHIVLWG